MDPSTTILPIKPHLGALSASLQDALPLLWKRALAVRLLASRNPALLISGYQRVEGPVSCFNYQG